MGWTTGILQARPTVAEQAVRGGAVAGGWWVGGWMGWVAGTLQPRPSAGGQAGRGREQLRLTLSPLPPPLSPPLPPQDPSEDRRFHIVITAQGSAVHWQSRVHYYW